MTPKEYETLQQAFLELKDLGPEKREQQLLKFEIDEPEFAMQLRRLLNAANSEDSFLQTGIRQDKLQFPTGSEETRAVSASVDSDVELPKHIGPYRVLQRIGEGGHGIVVMAEQTEPIRRKVAIKWIKPGMESKMILARFEAERQALALMKHPSIANVIDAGATESGQPYFVMELVHGVSIDQFCRDNQLKLNERLELFRQVCDAVHHAHRKGIIHRDIKPGNVLVTVDSGRPLAKVIDFGIAKAMHMDLTDRTLFTEYGQIIGTLEYMSPEQAMMSSGGADVRSDVYSLGAMLYLLLTGATPISKNELLRDGIWELKKILQEHQPQTPSLRITGDNQPQRWRDHAQTQETWHHRIKGDLDWITMKALAKEPDKRYDSAANLSQDIQKFLLGDKIEARPPSVVYNISKFLKRHKVAASVSLILVTSVFVSMIAIVWGYFQSQENLSEAKRAQKTATEKTELLSESLQETELERKRADLNAQRMAKLLKRNLLERGWSHAITGDAIQTQKFLDDIPDEEQDYLWRFVDTASQQMNQPPVRREEAGAIRICSFQRQLNLMALITTESELELWDLSNRSLLKKVALPTGIYSTISFSDDGKVILVGGPQQSIQLVNLDDDSISQKSWLKRGGIRRAVHDSLNKRWLITTGANYLIAVDESSLEIQTNVRLPNRIADIWLAPDSNWVFTASLNGECYVMRSSDLSDVRTISGSTTQIVALTWKADEIRGTNQVGEFLSIQMVAMERAGERDEKDRLEFRVKGNKSLSNLHSFTSDLTQQGNLVIGSSDGDIQVQNQDERQSILIQAHLPSITKVAVLDGSNDVMVVHFNGRVTRISSKQIGRHRSFASGLADLKDGIGLADHSTSLTGHADGTIKRWNSDLGSVVMSQHVHDGEVLGMSVHEESGKLASIGTDWKIVLSDLNNLNSLKSIPVDLGVRKLAFSMDGKILAAAPDRNNSSSLREGTIDLWNVRTGKAILRLSGHQNWVTQLQFFDQDAKLATLSLDGTARVWSVESGECLQVFELSEFPSAGQMQVISPEPKIAFGHSDGSVSLWDRENGSLIQSRRILGGEIDGMLAPPNSGCLMINSGNAPFLTFLDASTLKTTAKFDIGIGNILATRVDLRAHRIQVLGAKGALRLWELPHAN